LFLSFRSHHLLFISSGPQIGQGQFSKVYIGKYFGDYVAIKKQIRQDKVLDCYLLRELSVLKNAIHENLVGYFGASNEVATSQSKLNALYIVTEFCQVSIS
jgi:serine/threonine protein kinase